MAYHIYNYDSLTVSLVVTIVSPRRQATQGQTARCVITVWVTSRVKSAGLFSPVRRGAVIHTDSTAGSPRGLSVHHVAQRRGLSVGSVWDWPRAALRSALKVMRWFGRRERQGFGSALLELIVVITSKQILRGLAALYARLIFAVPVSLLGGSMWH